MKTCILRDPQAVEPQKVRSLEPHEPATDALVQRILTAGHGPALYMGLDVHTASIAVSLAPGGSTEVRRYGLIGGTYDDVLKLSQETPGRPARRGPPVLLRSRAATGLRLAAQGLNSAQKYFGDRYRRWQARLGTPKTITAMAHKLARILWHLFKHRQAFNPEVFRKEEVKRQRKRLARLQNAAAALGLKLVPAP